MASFTNVNLYNIYRNCCHVPYMKEDPNMIPLYAFVPGTNNDEVSKLSKDAAWVEACKTTYNSPTNIRRVIITGSRFYVQTYVPFMRNGKPSTEGNWFIRKNPGEEQLNACKMSMFNYILPDVAPPKGEKVSRLIGKPFSCIKMPWVLSNVTELVLDESMLYHQSVLAELQKEYCNADIANIYKQDNIKMMSRIFTSAMFPALTGDTKPSDYFGNLQKLKAVYVVHGLEKVLNGDKQLLGKLGKLTEKTVVDELLDLRMIRTIHVISIPNQGCPKVDSGELSVRTYYKFDKEILYKYAASYRSVVEAEYRNKANSADESARQAQEEKIIEETVLEQIIAEAGIDIARESWIVATAAMKPSERAHVYSLFSPELQAKLGLKY